jgi:nucleoside-diphosphate-sugar epimerase
MRILVAGATGVLGRATLPHLDRHDVLGLTREREKLPLLRALGAEGVVCDIYDLWELLRLTQERKPDVVVNFVTDLSAGISEANNRARREGGKNLVSAARQRARDGSFSRASPFHSSVPPQKRSSRWNTRPWNPRSTF